jgi:hypothetical protein
MAEPTLKFGASRKRMTIEFHEPPTLATLEAISARLRNDGARSLHVIVAFDWRDPQARDWRDPRHVPQLEKALNPSIEAFIFDAPSDAVARQSRNTVGDICDVLETCPRLQRAFVTGCSTMRKTRHEHLRELYLIGEPLDASVIPGLAASQFPSLERLVLEQFGLRAGELAESLRAIEAPRLREVYIEGVTVIEFLDMIGTAMLPWTLCIRDPCFDDVDRLFEVLEQRNELRSGKLRLDSEKLFDSEIAKLEQMGVTIEDMRYVFNPRAYANW